MNANGIERDFLKEVREANPEDCKTIVAALLNLEGREDAEGELTPLGELVAGIIEELTVNGVWKRNYERGGNV